VVDVLLFLAQQVQLVVLGSVKIINAKNVQIKITVHQNYVILQLVFVQVIQELHQLQQVLQHAVQKP
jgi:hypothetical protein